MRNRTLALTPNQPDPDLLHRLFFVQQVCLVLVVQIAAITLLASLLAPLSVRLPADLMEMRTSSALASLFSAFSLFLSESTRSRRMLYLSRFFAVLTALVAVTSLLEGAIYISAGMRPVLNANQALWHQGGASLTRGAAFVLLAIVLILIRSAKPAPGRIADLLASCLCLLVLILLFEYLFGVFDVPGSSTAGLTSIQTLICLVLLTAVAVLRRAERGIFSIVLGNGMGSRISRGLAPVLLVLPFLREVGRAHLVNAQLIPPRYSTAILTSVATVIAFALLLFFANRINGMEEEIQDLTLRDELTGLYNLRGFQLLAGQSLRLAQRAKVAFSVLFIDLDNLKKINDELGHGAGSASLVETGELLKSIFRETDVIGRVGGDEFAVAGQFSVEEISIIAKGLDEASTLRNSKAGQQFHLSFSTGHVTSDGNLRDTLKDLVSKADKAMYQEKRRKKLQAK